MLVRKSDERGKNKIEWLDARHSFSFGHYFDPRWTHFQNLLVINEDKISPAMGFGTHPHKDMEIITYIIEGGIRHRDSMGNLGIITPGEIQVMSAGTGVTHSEHNNETNQTTHLLQIWIHPNAQNLAPRYQQRRVYDPNEQNILKVIAGPKDHNDVIKLNADAQIWMGKFNQQTTINFEPTEFKNFWIQIIKGYLEITNQTFHAGDGIGFTQTAAIQINIHSPGAEFLIMELT